MKIKQNKRTNAKRTKCARKNPARPNIYEIPILETRAFASLVESNIWAPERDEDIGYIFVKNNMIDETLEKIWPSTLPYSEHARTISKNWILSIIQEKLIWDYKFPKTQKNIASMKKFENLKKFEAMVSDLKRHGQFESGFTQPKIKDFKIRYIS